MTDLVFEVPNRAAVNEIEAPRIGPDEVLIRSRAVGICHSDFELFEGRYIIPISYPIIPGREWAGGVVGVGSAVRDLRAGDAVVGECVVGPGGRDHFGFSIHGADADYFKARGEVRPRAPEEIAFRTGALVEPFSVAYNAVLTAGGMDAS